MTAYKQIAKLQPNDPNIQLELAQAAQQAGDTAAAIAAYKTFLKLAPDDPNAARSGSLSSETDCCARSLASHDASTPSRARGAAGSSSPPLL